MFSVDWTICFSLPGIVIVQENIIYAELGVRTAANHLSGLGRDVQFTVRLLGEEDLSRELAFKIQDLSRTK